MANMAMHIHTTHHLLDFTRQDPNLIAQNHRRESFQVCFYVVIDSDSAFLLFVFGGWGASYIWRCVDLAD